LSGLGFVYKTKRRRRRR